MNLWQELEGRGMVHQVTDPELSALLARDQLTVYTGFDATADSFHVGSLVPIIGLQRLQRGGHVPIALLGGGTTLIGDPSGRETERPLLSVEEIEANAGGLKSQLERFLDFSPGPTQARLLDNAEWLQPLRLTEFLRDVGKHFTVNTMMAKESVRSRLSEREQGISYTEFSYMLLQAYDFLHLFDAHGCRLQLGGSDQWGNITAGIDLIRRVRGEPAYGLTWPLLTRADGAKFGKSEVGNVWLDPKRTSPYRFYQYWLTTTDDDLGRYLRLFTDLRLEEIGDLVKDPRVAQHRLAHEVTVRVHGEHEAKGAGAASEVLFGSGDPAGLDEQALVEVFAEAPSSTEPRARLEGGVPLIDLLDGTSLARSKAEARKAIAGGGVYLNGRREPDQDRRITTGDLLHDRWLVLRKGKKSYHVVLFD